MVLFAKMPPTCRARITARSGLNHAPTARSSRKSVRSWLAPHNLLAETASSWPTMPLDKKNFFPRQVKIIFGSSLAPNIKLLRRTQFSQIMLNHLSYHSANCCCLPNKSRNAFDASLQTINFGWSKYRERNYCFTCPRRYHFINTSALPRNLTSICWNASHPHVFEMPYKNIIIWPTLLQNLPIPST